MKYCFVAGLATVATGSFAFAQSAELIILPRLPDNRLPDIKGVSGDGSVVFGSSLGGSRAFRWDRSSGLQYIPSSAGLSFSIAYAASSDGSRIAGVAGHETLGQVGFVWNADDTVVLLSDSSGDRLYSGMNISGDGMTVVGDALAPSRRGAFWTFGSGLTLMPVFADGSRPGTIGAVNWDGSIVAGMGSSSPAYRWTASEGYTMLGTLGGQLPVAIVFDMSESGEIIVGRSSRAGGGYAGFIWTEHAGMNVLPTVGSDPLAAAYGSSADGRVIVGWSGSGLGLHGAMMYTEGLGSVHLERHLNENYGFSLAPTSMYEANGVSSDGRTIVGGGGQLGYWVLTLPAHRPADFNVDEHVDFFDLADFLDCFEGRSILPVSSADLNRDGFTDFFDLIEFLDNF